MIRRLVAPLHGGRALVMRGGRSQAPRPSQPRTIRILKASLTVTRRGQAGLTGRVHDAFDSAADVRSLRTITPPCIGAQAHAASQLVARAGAARARAPAGHWGWPRGDTAAGAE